MISLQCQKVEEDERTKARLEEELSAQRKAGREAEAREQKATSEAVGLRQKFERAKSDYESTLIEVQASKEECERRISKMLSTRDKASRLNNIGSNQSLSCQRLRMLRYNIYFKICSHIQLGASG